MKRIKEIYYYSLFNGNTVLVQKDNINPKIYKYDVLVADTNSVYKIVDSFMTRKEAEDFIEELEVLKGDNKDE